MKWIKQSFAFIKKHPKDALILAILALLIIYASSFLGLFGVILSSAGFVFLQARLFQGDYKVRPSMALALTSFILIPTNIMMGSVSGLAKGSDSAVMAMLMIAIFSVMCSLAYLVIAHTVGFIVVRQLRFGLALEAALAGCGKNRLAFFGLSCLSALLLLVAILPMGLGLVICLPVLFYTYYFLSGIYTG